MHTNKNHSEKNVSKILILNQDIADLFIFI
jgi:hypothetical protein